MNSWEFLHKGDPFSPYASEEPGFLRIADGIIAGERRRIAAERAALMTAEEREAARERQREWWRRFCLDEAWPEDSP